MDVLDIVKNYIIANRLLRPGDTVLLAVSGGMDSMAMTDILWRLSGPLDFQPLIASFDHQLRPEAAEEAQFVRAAAEALGLPFYLGTADVGALARGKNIQDTARRERYAFLFSTAYRLGADCIATAHHCDDQAETLLLHLLRGCGTAGLAGMSPSENRVIRPLLPLCRADIAAYVEQRGLEYRDDSSNFTVKYQRNRIRWQLLPVLKEFNPKIVESLNATADICRDEDALLNDLAENAMAELLLRDDRAIDGEGFALLPPALQRRVLRKAFCLLAGDAAELSFAQVEAILALKEEQSVTLPGTMLAYRRGNICFDRQVPPLPVYEDIYPLIVDGAWHTLGQWGWAYTASIERTLPLHLPSCFYVEAEQTADLYWRTRRPGDHLQNSAGNGRSKLKDIFIDNKVPVYQRPGWPLLCCGQQILWAARLKRAAQQLPKTEKSVLIKVKHCDIIS